MAGRRARLFGQLELGSALLVEDISSASDPQAVAKRFGFPDLTDYGTRFA